MKGVEYFLKRLISLTAAIALMISIINISVYAALEPSAMTPQEYKLAQSYLIDKYCNGDITFLEWQEQQAAVNTEFLESNKSVGDTAYAVAITTSNQFSGIAQKISSAFSQWGDDARERVSDWWNSICGSNNVPTETVQTPTTDYMGNGALFINVCSDSYSWVRAYDYIVVEILDDGRAHLTCYADTFRLYHIKNGVSTLMDEEKWTKPNSYYRQHRTTQ